MAPSRLLKYDICYNILSHVTNYFGSSNRKFTFEWQSFYGLQNHTQIALSDS
jgi:hypothetical protein